MQEAHEQKERNMNLQTMENTMPKTAQNVASQLIFSSKRMAQNCHKSPLVSENCLRISALSGVDWKTFGPTRVKHRTMHVNRRNTRFVFVEIPERAVNKGDILYDCTANAPQGEE